MPRSLFQSCWLFLVLLGPGLASLAGAEGPGSNHWAFQPVVRPTVPVVHNAHWIRNPIDNFVLAKLESLGIEPSPEADRATLAKRPGAKPFEMSGRAPTRPGRRDDDDGRKITRRCGPGPGTAGAGRKQPELCREDRKSVV